MNNKSKIITKEEFIAKMNHLVEEKILETGKSRLEIFREMEYHLEQKEKRESLTNFEKGMLRTLRKVEGKCFSPEKLARDFKKMQQSFRIKLLTDFMIDFCKCWNNLDTSFIEPYLHENVQYKSKWADSAISSKSEYLDYLNDKFQTLRRTLDSNLKADAGYIKGDGKYEIGTPCVVLTQKLHERTNNVVLLFTGTKNKITRIEMNEAPEERLVDYGIYYS
ncbi:MAG: hypothetical protein JXR34_12920 [Bacteroidales bacterium]|nr:hypothetical protein [Bacteroidales bacterium]